MSPLQLETPDECGRSWNTADAVAHQCTQTPGHGNAHRCYCGAENGGVA